MRRGTSAGSSAKSSNVFDHMTDRITFRPARLQDFEFCQRLFFEGMGWIIEALCLDMARQHESFASQWKLEEVRVITVAGEDAGWLQTAPADEAIFPGKLYLARTFQSQGIGGHVVQLLIEEASRSGKAITLGMVKINPARRLYERLAFRVTHEDQHKVYMRRDPN